MSGSRNDTPRVIFMLPLIEQSKGLFTKVVDHLKNELKTIRTGRAHPAILDHCMVEAYGVKTPLRELASIGTTDARTLTIQPWDKNILKDIEKGIIEARVGASPVVDGAIIRLVLPTLTEESRKELGKTISGKLEDAKQLLRRERDTLREQILSMEKGGKITEDDKYRAQKDLDTITQEFQIKLATIADEKITEIMTL